MNFLNVENPFFRGVWKFMNLILLNLLWVLCCVPVFTIGASTSALYYAVQKNVKNDRGNTAQVFFRGFKENFKQSTLIWLVMMVLIYVFSFDLWFFINYGKDGHPVFYSLRFIFYVVLFIVALYYVYIFPYLARFKNTIKHVLYNSTLLIIRHPIQLLKNIFFVGFCCFMVWFLPFLFFVMPAVCMWQISFVMEKIYQIYMSPEDKELEEQRNAIGDPNEF